MRFHGSNTHEPFTAPYDILVDKVIKLKNNWNYSPVMETPLVYVDEDTASLKSNLVALSYYNDFGVAGTSVNQGIHSFYVKGQEFLYLMGIPTFDILKCKKAIIPKGSKFYIGINGDVASDKLIIYLKNFPYHKKIHTIIDFILEYERERTE